MNYLLAILQSKHFILNLDQRCITSCSAGGQCRMPSITRTVRFQRTEIRRIEDFLAANPFFDFSQLARLSIKTFIENPQLVIKKVPSIGRSHGIRESKQNGAQNG